MANKCDEEQLSSDADDDDYAPSDAGSDSDSPAADTDDDLHVNDGPSDAPASRKRKRGVDAGDGGDQGSVSAPAEEKTDPVNVEKKARIDSLWESFKKGPAKPDAQSTEGAQAAPVAATAKKPSRFAAMGVGATATAPAPTTVTKTYSFAGETVSVTETAPAGTAAKKPSNPLDDILAKMKPPKISTLDKSRLDWQTFKTKEGIADELAHHNKDGYLEKKAFLERADVRQWESEREQRMGRRS